MMSKFLLYCVLFSFICFVVALLSFLNHRKLLSSNKITSTIFNQVSDYQNHKVDLRSDIVDKDVRMIDESDFENFLNSIGFWKENGMMDIKTNKSFTAKNLIIILSPLTAMNNATVQTVDSNKITWNAIDIKVDEKNDMIVSVFRKDWNEYTINLLINEALWRTSAKYHLMFSQELTDQEKRLINQQFIKVENK